MTNLTPHQFAVEAKHGARSVDGPSAKVYILQQDEEVRRLWQGVLEASGHRVLSTGIPGRLPSTAVSGLLGADGYDLVIAESAALRHEKDFEELRRLLHPAGHLVLAGPVVEDWLPPDDAGIRHWSRHFLADQLLEEARDAAWITGTAPKPVVIICDDCPHIRALFSTAAASVGFEPVCTDNGADVVPLVDRFDACAVILDLLMPVHDGLETMRFIRESGLNVDVIAVSGGFSLYLQVAGALGARHVLTKPVHVETLRQILWSIARRQEPRLPTTASGRRNQ